MPPCKIQSAKHKVLDEITGFARSRHPVKVHCYQWTTSNFIERGPGVEPGFGAATPTMLLQKHRFRTNHPPKERASGHLAIQQFTKAHSGCSPSLLHQYSCTWFNHRLKLLHGIFVRPLKDITVDNPRMANGTALNLILVATQTPEVNRSHSIGLVVTLA